MATGTKESVTLEEQQLLESCNLTSEDVSIPKMKVSRKRKISTVEKAKKTGKILVVTHGTTSEQPDNTSKQLGTTSKQTGTSSEQPDTCREQPGTTTEQPGTSKEPGTTTEQPGTTTEQPGTTTEQPGTSTEQPGTTTEQHYLFNYSPLTGIFSSDFFDNYNCDHAQRTLPDVFQPTTDNVVTIPSLQSEVTLLQTNVQNL